MDLTSFVQFALYGVSLGGTYALVAVGYTIIYGVVGLINQAHAVFFTMAAFAAGWAVLYYKVPLVPALLLGAVLTCVTAVVVERIVYRPLRANRISAFTAAIGVALIIQNIMIIFFSAMSKPFPRPGFLDGRLYFAGLEIPTVSLFVFVVCMALFLILHYVVNKTLIGTAMRALSKDMLTVELMGVDIDRVITFAFALSAIYAAAGAYLWCFRFPATTPYVGDAPAFKAFIGAVIGGIGSIPGALLGAFLIGGFEMMFIGLFPMQSGWRDVFSFALLILFLLIRPGGIFNVKVVEEKV